MHYGIIAAGNGSRLQQEGATRPKPLVEIEGMPMIRRLAEIFRSAQAESIAIIVNREMTQVQEYVRSLAEEWPALIRLVVESTPSSFHSFARLAELMPRGGKFVITTVDTIFRREDFLRYTERFSQESEIDGLMGVTSYIDDEKPLYVATAPDMAIKAFCDTRQADCRYVSGGIYGLGPAVFPVIDRCMREGVARMRNFQRMLVADGVRLKAFDMGKILDIDHVEDIGKARRFLARQQP